MRRAHAQEPRAGPEVVRVRARPTGCGPKWGSRAQCSAPLRAEEAARAARTHVRSERLRVRSCACEARSGARPSGEISGVGSHRLRQGSV